MNKELELDVISDANKITADQIIKDSTIDKRNNVDRSFIVANEL